MQIPSEERDKLSTMLFWDVPRDKGNINRIIENNPDWLIQRAFERGTLRDVVLVMRWYGNDKVKETLRNAESLSKLCVGFACALLGMEKTDFKCYNYRRSNLIYY